MSTNTTNIQFDEIEQRDIGQMLQTICRRYESYSGEGSQRILEAYQWALEAHVGQVRATGEPYIIHPLATAEILTELEMDSDTIVAALLHDTVEDTARTIEEVRERFGPDIAALVDGVTKLERISFSSKEEIDLTGAPRPRLAAPADCPAL